MMKNKCKGVKNCVCCKNIGDRLRHFSPVVRAYEEGDTATRQKLLKKACPCFVRLICETCLNVLKGNVKLNAEQYEKLKPHKQRLLQLSRPSISSKKRKEVLVKKGGGGLPLLLSGVGILMNVLNSFL